MKRLLLPLLPSALSLAGCGGPTQPSDTPAAVPSPATQGPITPTTPLLAEDMQEMSQLVQLPNRVAFDLPALYYKTVPQIQQLLGPPNWDSSEPNGGDKTSLEPLPKEWDKTYCTDSVMLNIRYFYRTGKVKYFYLEPRFGCVDATPAGVQALLAAGNLTPASRQYRSVPVYYDHKPASHRYSSLMLVPR